MEDSFQKRYIAKLTTNLIGILPALINTFLVPRMLGPGAFGIYNFLEDFFIKLYGFLSPGVTTCFFTRLSQEPEKDELKRFFWFLTLVIIGCATVFTFGSLAIGIGDTLWPEVDPRFVVLGLLVVTGLWLQEILVQVVDAYGFTVPGERVKLAIRIGASFVLALLFLIEVRSSEAYFVYRLLFALALIWGFIYVVRKKGGVVFPKTKLTKGEISTVGKDFWRYSSPLILFGIMGAIVSIGDRWLLQRFAGSEQQGFFSLGLKVSLLVFLVVQPITILYTREISRAHARGDDEEIRNNTRKLLPRFFTIAAFFSVFCACNSQSIVLLAGGKTFEHASLAVGIMALYPMSQTYGQLTGAIFFATDKTRSYRNIGMTVLVIGLPLTWLLLAPEEWGGLDLGSVGISIKTVGITLVSVNVSLWICCRQLGLKFIPFLIHELFCVSSFAFCSLLAMWLVSKLNLSESVIAGLLGRGSVYTLLCIGLIVGVPWLAGFNVTERDRIVRKIKSRWL